MYILGIESSCDETAVSVIERGEINRVICEKIKTQIDIHTLYGGVVPEIASRSHYEAIDLLCNSALNEAGIGYSELDYISATRGPGLIGSLLVGFSFAKALSYAISRPLISVDHISAHIESAFIEKDKPKEDIAALVVSGGHTTLFHNKYRGKTSILARTRDDAVGEVMDKVAKYFGLGYPGGPLLDSIHDRGDYRRFAFTRPRMSDGSNDFSFSGYKTAVIKHARELNAEAHSGDFYDLVSSLLYSLVRYLMHKTFSSVEELGINHLAVAGGVSRNTLLRKMFKEECEKRDVKLYMPEPVYCTDNASMIAWRAYEELSFSKGKEEPFANVYSRAFVNL